MYVWLLFQVSKVFLYFFRGYAGKKLEENLQCEIFQTILDEAKEAFSPDIVFELPSNTVDDMESNIDKIVGWIEMYKQKRCTMET